MCINIYVYICITHTLDEPQARGEARALFRAMSRTGGEDAVDPNPSTLNPEPQTLNHQP